MGYSVASEVAWTSAKETSGSFRASAISLLPYIDELLELADRSREDIPLQQGQGVDFMEMPLCQ